MKYPPGVGFLILSVALALSMPTAALAQPHQIGGVGAAVAPPELPGLAMADEPVPDILVADGDPLRTTTAQVRSQVAPGEQVDIGVATADGTAGAGPAGVNITTVTATGPDEAAALITEVAAQPDVLAVGLPQPITTFEEARDPYRSARAELPVPYNQYGLDMLCADVVATVVGCGSYAWQYADGTGQTVAVLDQGVDTTHPDLASALVAGANCADTSADGCIPVAQTAPLERADHATHVAGTIVAVPDNGIAVAGLAPGAAVMPVEVIGPTGSGSTTTLARGITWAVDNGATVLNMSLGTLGVPSDPVLEVAVAHALYLGVPLLAAAGNDGPTNNRVAYPAAYPGVVGVGNIDHTQAVNSRSTRGAWVDVVAPGTNVVSTIRSENPGSASVGWLSGTSMATPHVAALVAMLRQRQPNMTVTELTGLLAATATDLGAKGRDDAFGHGLIAPVAALQSPPKPADAVPAGATFHPVAPARVLDTRTDPAGAIQRREARKVFVGHDLGTGKVVVPPGAVAVAYNLTVANPQATGHLRVMPGDTAFTAASAINVAAGQNAANGLVVALDEFREIRIFNALPVAADAVVDVLGYFLPEVDQSAPGASAGGRFTPIAPTRVFDSSAPGGRLNAGETRTLRVDVGTAGQAEVVAAGATAIAYNITVVEPGAAGHLRVMPGDVAATQSSAINWRDPSDKIANGLVVKVSADRTVRVFNSAPTAVTVLIDVVGYYGATGALFYPIAPARAYDSRQPQPVPGPLAPGSERAIFLGDGRNDSGAVTTPAVVPPGAAAVAYNITVPQSGPSLGGHLRLWPEGIARPNASVINWPVGGASTRANGLAAGISPSRAVRVYNGSSTPSHVIVDVLGYYR